MKSKKDKKNLLYKVCRDFIKKYDISCSEQIGQSDEIAENSLDFIEAVCKVVGYCKDSDNDE